MNGKTYADNDPNIPLDTNGSWQAKFVNPHTKVSRVEITTTKGSVSSYLAAKAKVYVGSTLCGTLPEGVEKSKMYSVDCNVFGQYVKI